MQLGQLLCDPSILGTSDKFGDSSDKTKSSRVSFSEAVEALRLPKVEAKEKGKQGNASKKKQLTFEPHHMITKIDLSGFAHCSISKSSIKELLESVEQLPCLKSLSLKNNGITDDYDKEILMIFDNKQITNIDLSQNLIKKLGLAIGKKLKDECNHITWIDLTQNDFDHDQPTIAMIINGLKKQKELIYVGLTAEETQVDQIVRLVQAKKPAISLNIRNSKLGKSATDYLTKSLQNTDTMLTGLSLKFCFLSFEQILSLANALRFSKNLVKLDLSNNGIRPKPAAFLLDSIQQNMSLTDINFHGNFLDNEFAVDLSYVLEKNPVLYKVDISQNPIGPEGARFILNALLSVNDTLGSLGDLSQNVYMGVRIREELAQALLLNN